MLTAKQKQVFDFIVSYQKSSGGVSPSFQEMSDALGITGRSGINRLISALVERGFVRHTKGTIRNIEVVRRPKSPGWQEFYVWDWTSQSLKPRGHHVHE